MQQKSWLSFEELDAKFSHYTVNQKIGADVSVTCAARLNQYFQNMTPSYVL